MYRWFLLSITQLLSVNGGQAVEDAFMRMFGISLKKANALNMSDLDVRKG